MVKEISLSLCAQPKVCFRSFSLLRCFFRRWRNGRVETKRRTTLGLIRTVIDELNELSKRSCRGNYWENYMFRHFLDRSLVVISCETSWVLWSIWKVYEHMSPTYAENLIDKISRVWWNFSWWKFILKTVDSRSEFSIQSLTFPKFSFMNHVDSSFESSSLILKEIPEILFKCNASYYIFKWLHIQMILIPQFKV